MKTKNKRKIGKTIAQRFRRMVCDLKTFIEQSDSAARCLRREVDDGRCIRQSPESKMARVIVLECHRDWAKQVLSNAEIQ